VVRDVSDRVVVLDHGVKLAEGTYEEVSTNEQVIEAYLGARPTRGRTSDRRPNAGPRVPRVNTHYGPVHILKDVNIEIHRRDRVPPRGQRLGQDPP
jgi:ABC-type branched-subunit amino acid transport system ATPase component